MKQCKQNIYEDIIREAEQKQRQRLISIRNSCCPECKNKAEGCLKLEHLIKDGVEIYRCKNYSKRGGVSFGNENN
jgi:hypothetical protein